MKRCVLPVGLLAIAVLTGAALYWSGNYIVYMLAYTFSFVFLLCDAIFTVSSIPEKIMRAVVYALILAAQILFVVLVMRPVASSEPLFDLYRLVGVLIIPVPFLVRRLYGSDV